MMNPLDIKRLNNYNYILSTELEDNSVQIDYSEIVIVVHLFYIDTIEYYFSFLLQIPRKIHVIFTYSDDDTLNKIKELCEKHEIKSSYVFKENRGRDLSALLVAAKSIKKYKYVCFLHDKKPKSTFYKEDTEEFVYCLWHNMLATTTYINNILALLVKNKHIGVLLPPESMSDNFNFVQKNTWDDDFDLMKQIADKANLICDLDKQKKPISLGTVFWAKVDAIKKLLKMGWKYSDFEDEPMPLDGTISHALERSFAYFAQDAGFATGIVMSDKFAGKRVDVYQDYIFKAFKILRDEFAINSYRQLKMWLMNRKPTPKIIASYSERYIYGAGKFGNSCAKTMALDGISFSGYIVSSLEGNPKEINYHQVKKYSDIEYGDNTCVIIAVSRNYIGDILNNLLKTSIKKENIFVFPWVERDYEQ